MRYFTNHCWCSRSMWGGHFDCRFIITIEEKQDAEDWKLLIKEESCFSKEHYECNKRAFPDVNDEKLKAISMTSSITLQPHVIKWLEDNVKDRRGEEINRGWTIGTLEYNRTSRVALDVFFHRRGDAMKFIKTFSKYKKPTFYFDYFRDIRKHLNLETGKYGFIEREA